MVASDGINPPDQFLKGDGSLNIPRKFESEFGYSIKPIYQSGYPEMIISKGKKVQLK